MKSCGSLRRGGRGGGLVALCISIGGDYTLEMRLVEDDAWGIDAEMKIVS